MHELKRLADSLQLIAKRPQPLRPEGELEVFMRGCIEHGLDDLAAPGSGSTLERWRALALVAGHDLALAKLYESHTDARAILTELGAGQHYLPGIWAVWAAEPPHARLEVAHVERGVMLLNGRKAWCSGARQIDHALVTAWSDDQQPQLLAVNLRQPQVQVGSQGWQAVGMAATASVEVEFNMAPARPIGLPGDYLRRPGFWHGGAGIAACWYGAAVALADYLKRACTGRDDAHAQAHLGAVDVSLQAAASSLRDTARWIDANPQRDAQLLVLRVRAQVERAAEAVLRHVGRALGAAPYCQDARFARLAADLPVFMRQSHAERDLAELGRLLVVQQPDASWEL